MKTTAQIDFDIFAGVDSGGDTPDPIPNSEVKPASGDGSAGVTLWESSTMPAFYLLTQLGNQLGFFLPFSHFTSMF